MKIITAMLDLIRGPRWTLVRKKVVSAKITSILRSYWVSGLLSIYRNEKTGDEYATFVDMNNRKFNVQPDVANAWLDSED